MKSDNKTDNKLIAIKNISATEVIIIHRLLENITRKFESVLKIFEKISFQFRKAKGSNREQRIVQFLKIIEHGEECE